MFCRKFCFEFICRTHTLQFTHLNMCFSYHLSQFFIGDYSFNYNFIKIIGCLWIIEWYIRESHCSHMIKHHNICRVSFYIVCLCACFYNASGSLFLFPQISPFLSWNRMAASDAFRHTQAVLQSYQQTLPCVGSNHSVWLYNASTSCSAALHCVIVKQKRQWMGYNVYIRAIFTSHL